jgi:hypothetical protein
MMKQCDQMAQKASFSDTLQGKNQMHSEIHAKNA